MAKRKGNGQTTIVIRIDGKEVELFYDEVELIKRVASGQSFNGAIKGLDIKITSMARIADRIRRNIGKDIKGAMQLICWFAYAAGLVQL